jgi:prolipoprotein diacylglyceryl transferase
MTPLAFTIPSPPQGVWTVGPVPLRAYAIAIIAGIVIAGIWGNRRLVARGGRPGAITDLAVWMVPFGLVGGRLYHIITDPELYFGDPAIPGHNWNPWGVFEIWNGGLGIWGAIALGGLGAYLGARRYKIPFGAVADALAPCIVLAQGIGRIGNYFNQELFGSPTTVPWGLDVFLRTPGGIAGTAAQCGTGEFPTEWIKADPTVLCGTYQPTFLYELVWDVAVALFVVWADRKFRLGHGRAFALYVAGYTAGRGWIEMLRIDHANHILGLRVNVFVAVALFLAAVIYLIASRRATREDPVAVYGIVPGKRGAVTAADGPDDADASNAAGASNDVDGSDASGGSASGSGGDDGTATGSDPGEPNPDDSAAERDDTAPETPPEDADPSSDEEPAVRDGRH